MGGEQRRRVLELSHQQQMKVYSSRTKGILPLEGVDGPKERGEKYTTAAHQDKAECKKKRCNHSACWPLSEKEKFHRDGTSSRTGLRKKECMTVIIEHAI